MKKGIARGPSTLKEHGENNQTVGTRYCPTQAQALQSG